MGLAIFSFHRPLKKAHRLERAGIKVKGEKMKKIQGFALFSLNFNLSLLA
jgi:hypothetical protein